METRRLFIYPASREQMETAIANERDEDLKTAYGQMLDGCQREPEKWAWYAMWMIELKNGTHVGDLCFKGFSPEGVSEIGYGVLETYQGNGYCTEAVRAVLDWAFSQPGVTAIEAEAEENNLASRRVLEKCGFIPNGTVGLEGPRYTLKRGQA